MGGGTHARFHNVYGMLMAMATRQGLRRARPGLRPFVLTRANFIGGQRYAAAWTGDNTSNWEHVSLSIPMALNLGLSGQPFAGPDIGGFLGNCPPDMYARWLGIGALLPFCRAHADKGSNAKEPWSFGMSVEATCRRAIERRYRLLPYLYTVFEQAAGTGLPVVRPVFFADPGDPSLRAEDASFLLGDDLLVQAQPRESRAHVHALPKGDWKELSFEAARDPDLPVLRLRPGALIPTGPVIQHTGEPVTRLQLYANLDANGEAVGWLYEDEGDGYGYLEGVYSRRKLRARRSGSTVLVQVEERSGSFQGVDAWDLIVLGGG